MKNNEGESDKEQTPIDIEMPEEIQPVVSEIEEPTVDPPIQAEINEPVEQPDDAKQDDSDSGGCNSDWEFDEEEENEEIDIDKNLPFEIQFPMRKSFTFDNITICSDFDGGNMRRCKPSEPDAIKLNQNSPENAEQQNIEKKFDIWISWDGLPYRKSGLKTWFYFYVQGASMGESIKFTIKNMNRQARLYNMGLRPVFRVIPKTKNWQKIQGPTSWNRGKCGMEVNFQYTFTENQEDKVYFAFTYPYSYQDIQEKLQNIEERLKDVKYDNIYFHRELLGYSVENRRVDLVTLSSKSSITNDKEDLIDNCFPDHQGDKSKRPFKFDNK